MVSGKYRLCEPTINLLRVFPEPKNPRTGGQSPHEGCDRTVAPLTLLQLLEVPALADRPALHAVPVMLVAGFPSSVERGKIAGDFLRTSRNT